MRHGSASIARAGEREPKDHREPPVELRPLRWRQRGTLRQPRDRMGKTAEAKRQIEGLPPIAAPRLEIRVTQPREPRIVRGETVLLGKEPGRDEQREVRMRDRRVSPIKD